jgi:hypothetical protein
VFKAAAIADTVRFQSAVSSCNRRRVELRLAVVVALAPLRDDELLVLQPVERRIERPLGHLQRVARDLTDAQQHAVPVQRFERHRLEDQHVECAGKQVCGLGHLLLLAWLGVWRRLS